MVSWALQTVQGYDGKIRKIPVKVQRRALFLKLGLGEDSKPV